jgi:hypothetical protein
MNLYLFLDYCLFFEFLKYKCSTISVSVKRVRLTWVYYILDYYLSPFGLFVFVAFAQVDVVQLDMGGDEWVDK